jgi:hypothetical protein
LDSQRKGLGVTQLYLSTLSATRWHGGCSVFKRIFGKKLASDLWHWQYIVHIFVVMV